MDHFVAKPVLPDDIIQVLTQQFGGQAAMATPSPSRGAAAGSPPLVVNPTPANRQNPAPPPLDADTRTVSPAQDPHGPPGTPARQRFKSSDVAQHLDMAVIGDVCVGVSLNGLRSVLGSLLGDESGNLAQLLSDLDSGRTDRLRDNAHALKGAAASVGLRAIEATARTLETEGAGYQPADCTAAAAQLRSQWDTARALLKRMGFLT